MPLIIAIMIAAASSAGLFYYAPEEVPDVWVEMIRLGPRENRARVPADEIGILSVHVNQADPMELVSVNLHYAGSALPPKTAPARIQLIDAAAGVPVAEAPFAAGVPPEPLVLNQPYLIVGKKQYKLRIVDSNLLPNTEGGNSLSVSIQNSADITWRDDNVVGSYQLTQKHLPVSITVTYD